MDDPLAAALRDHLRRSPDPAPADATTSPDAPRLVLEVGCGDAALADRLAEAGVLGAAPGPMRGIRYLGVDLDVTALTGARRRGDPARWGLVGADALRLPLPASTVDAVVTRLLVHHLDVARLTAFVGEAARVLRSDGLLLVLDGRRLPAPVAQAMNAALDAGGHPPEPQAGVDVDALAVVLAVHGLDVTAVEPAGTVTFATPPFVPEDVTSPAFLLTAVRHARRGGAIGGASGASSTAPPRPV